MRYIGVTGVQTCALPIFGARVRGVAGEVEQRVHLRGPGPRAGAPVVAVPAGQPPWGGEGACRLRCRTGGGRRSEARRAGKEGRSRWSPEHYKTLTHDLHL